MTLSYLLKVKDSNRDHFSSLNVVISQTATNTAISVAISLSLSLFLTRTRIHTHTHAHAHTCTHTHSHTETHYTYTYDDSIRRNAMRCISSKNYSLFVLFQTGDIVVAPRQTLVQKTSPVSSLVPQSDVRKYTHFAAAYVIIQLQLS